MFLQLRIDATHLRLLRGCKSQTYATVANNKVEANQSKQKSGSLPRNWGIGVIVNLG